MSVCLSVCISVFVFYNRSQSACPACLPVCLSVCLSVYLSIYLLSIYLSIYLSNLSICLSKSKLCVYASEIKVRRNKHYIYQNHLLQFQCIAIPFSYIDPLIPSLFVLIFSQCCSQDERWRKGPRVSLVSLLPRVCCLSRAVGLSLGFEWIETLFFLSPTLLSLSLSRVCLGLNK